MRLIDPKTFRLELDGLDCIDKFGYVILPITKLNIALERSTVDAVPVVRCRDCVYRRENTTRYKKTLPYYCEIHAEKFCDLDEFCCYGKQLDGSGQEGRP